MYHYIFLKAFYKTEQPLKTLKQKKDDLIK